MFNVIKQAAVYTGVYFIIFTVFFWATIFVSIIAATFYKLFATVFFVILAVLTFNYFDCSSRIRRLFRSKSQARMPVTIKSIHVA